MNFLIDIYSDDETIEKMKEKYSLPTLESICQHFVTNNDKQDENKYTYDDSEEDQTYTQYTQYTPLSYFKVGDIVTVIYTPYSQKHIDFYEEQHIRGIIVYIDNENDDAIIIKRNKSDGMYIVQSLKRLFCSYYGNTKGYDYFIAKKQ